MINRRFTTHGIICPFTPLSPKALVGWIAALFPPLFYTLCLIDTNKREMGRKETRSSGNRKAERTGAKERQLETKRLTPQLIPWYYSCQSCIYFLSIWHMLLWLLNMPGRILCCAGLFIPPCEWDHVNCLNQINPRNLVTDLCHAWQPSLI